MRTANLGAARRRVRRSALPLALLERGAIDWHPALIGAMAWSVLVLTLGGSSLLYLLIQRGAATHVTSLMYLVPPCTALMAWLLFGETLGATVLLGLLLTVVGVAPGRARGAESHQGVTMTTHRIAVIAGDGIGREVMPEGLRVLDAAARRFGIALQLDHFDFANCDYFERHGTMMPADWKERIGGHDAILFGAVGWPATVPDHVSLWGSLLKFRRDFDQYVNLRPARLMPGIRSPLVDREGRPLAPGSIDMWIVRENTEGEYSSVGGRMFEGSEREIVMQQTLMSRVGVDRVLKFAFELAQSRPRKRLTSATKSNGIAITMPYWDERVEAMAASYPAVNVDRYHIDILAAYFVQRPQIFDVVVASNLFGDILSDLGPACTGTIGIAPSANLNPTPAMAVAVRAGARLGARHRRARRREPDRSDLVGGDDARLPGPPRRARRGARGDRGCARRSPRTTHAGSRRQGRHDRSGPALAQAITSR